VECKLFIFILRIIQFFRGVFIPCLALILFIFSKKLRKRYFFEDKNLTDIDKIFDRKADLAFEVSSEGEFEQIKPLLDHHIKKGWLIELIYSSDSLEEKIQILTKTHTNLRSLRLPILSYGLIQNDLLGFQNISSWLTAKQLILCRYDFYPELLLYGLRKDIRFCLVSATFRNKKDSWWNRCLYNSFDYILAASSEDIEKFKTLGIDGKKLSSYEFRIPQILERIELRLAKLGPYENLLKLIESYPKEKRIIFGSAWTNEMEVFSDAQFADEVTKGNLLILVLPHQFNNEIRDKLSSFPNFKVHSYKDGDDLTLLLENYNKEPGVILLEVKGILLELYSYFGHSFVGGGHGRSVHSLLEPFLSGCHIYCGPKVHRSTEYDFIQNNAPKDLTIVEDLGSFYRQMIAIGEKDLGSQRIELGNSFASSFENEVERLTGGSLT